MKKRNWSERLVMQAILAFAISIYLFIYLFFCFEISFEVIVILYFIMIS